MGIQSIQTESFYSTPPSFQYRHTPHLPVSLHVRGRSVSIQDRGVRYHGDGLVVQEDGLVVFLFLKDGVSALFDGFYMAGQGLARVLAAGIQEDTYHSMSTTLDG